MNSLFASGELDTYDDACRTAVRLGGEVLMSMYGQAKSWPKGPGDWVSQADFESQKIIRNYLETRFPQHAFIGEEQDDSENSVPSDADVNFCWIVDPLDGTMNYLHQLHSFAVSIGLLASDQTTGRKELVVGAVLDPVLDECFHARRSGGAWLNGQPIRVSDCKKLDGSLTVTSSSKRLKPDDPQIKRMQNVMATSSSVRRLGSAAINLCYVACGRVDAYWTTSVSCWDVAAGWLIATEAGAVLEDFDGKPIDVMRPHFCCAATVELMDEMRPLLRIG